MKRINKEVIDTERELKELSKLSRSVRLKFNIIVNTACH